MSFELPELNYGYDALEPHIDARTMEIHHGKHHQGYVDKLNKTLEGHQELQNKSIEDLLRGIEKVPDDIRQNVINNGGGHANHSLFWEILSPNPQTEPEGKLADAIESAFGGLEKFKEMFTEKAMGVFGSGWAFLVVDKNGELQVKRHSFQNSPLMNGQSPIFGLDLWEHAYYLKYQNRRAEYIETFWKVLNWEKAEENFLKSPKK